VTAARSLAALALAAALAALWAPPAAAEALLGPATAVDGDTLDVAGTRVRLKALHAPELHEPGGPEARDALAALVTGLLVACEVMRTRTRGRRLGYCSAGGVDLGEALIRAGLARSCPRYALLYERLPANAALPLPSYCVRRSR
jgi:micrococcal nuclease